MYQCLATLTTVPNALLPDEVWSQLDPRAARLSPRDRRRVALAFLVVLAVGLLTGWGAAAGFFRPNISATGTATTDLRPAAHAIVARIELENSGMIDERITAVGATDSNLAVSTTGLPMVIGAHHHATLKLQVRVRDCARVRNAEVQLRVTVERVWWHLSRDVGLPDSQDQHGRWSAAAVCH